MTLAHLTIRGTKHIDKYRFLDTRGRKEGGRKDKISKRHIVSGRMQSFASKLTDLKCVKVMSALLLALCERMCMLGHLRESLDIKGIVGRCDLFA